MFESQQQPRAAHSSEVSGTERSDDLPHAIRRDGGTAEHCDAFGMATAETKIVSTNVRKIGCISQAIGNLVKSKRKILEVLNKTSHSRIERTTSLYQSTLFSRRKISQYFLFSAGGVIPSNAKDI